MLRPERLLCSICLHRGEPWKLGVDAAAAAGTAAPHARHTSGSPMSGTTLPAVWGCLPTVCCAYMPLDGNDLSRIPFLPYKFVSSRPWAGWLRQH